MTNDELSAKVAEARGEVVYAANVFHFPSGVRVNDIVMGVKPYATCMNAAWELAMELHKETGWFGLSYCDESKDKVVNMEWTCSFGRADFGHTWETSTHSAAHAICRAYLAFKGVEI